MRALMPLLKVIVALVLISGMAAALSQSKDASEVILINSPGCTKCAAAERVLGQVGEEIPLNISRHYYYSDEGHRIIGQYKAKDVPAIIIGTSVINYRDYEGDNALLERLIRETLANTSPSLNPVISIPSNESANLSIIEDSPSLNLREFSIYTIFAVLGAGLVAGFNPCLLGILVFLAASVLSSTGRKREMVRMVVFFSLGIFTVYFLFGLGMQRLLATDAMASIFRYALSAFLLLAGLSQVLDAMRLARGEASLFRTDWALKYFQKGVDRGRFSSYFLIGALFSLVKAPCVGAIYLAILDLLSSQSYFAGAACLFLFNLGVVLPIIVLGGFIALGMSPEQVDAFRKDHRVGMRLVTGLALIALAPMIYWQWI
ncbi:MAG: cytochrome c biogenesis protein [Methanothrix sp.]|nr:cytochrome c biogenesis protein [Methanothrix sp.]